MGMAERRKRRNTNLVEQIAIRLCQRERERERESSMGYDRVCDFVCVYIGLGSWELGYRYVYESLVFVFLIDCEKNEKYR